MLTRMKRGKKYTASDWNKLLDLLVLPKAPEATVFVKDGSTLPAVRLGETLFWVRQLGNGSASTSSPWTITVCKPTDNTVSTYSVVYAEGERKDMSHIADMFGVQQHVLRYIYQQVRCSQTWEWP